jgi:hypothetical protein
VQRDRKFNPRRIASRQFKSELGVCVLSPVSPFSLLDFLRSYNWNFSVKAKKYCKLMVNWQFSTGYRIQANTKLEQTNASQSRFGRVLGLVILLLPLQTSFSATPNIYLQYLLNKPRKIHFPFQPGIANQVS